jgi:type II restriction enzyme
MKLTAADLVREINTLKRGEPYRYAEIQTKTKVELIGVELPEGPITILRDGKRASISVNQIWQLANALSDKRLVNVDELYKGSLNTRSAFEALILHTRYCYLCYPKRLDPQGSTYRVKTGHKHIYWNPDEPHKIGEIIEIPTEQMVYSVEVPVGTNVDDINLKRRHTQMQVALIEIGKRFGFKSWIAVEDKHIEYEGQRLDALESVLNDLSEHPIFRLPYEEAIETARHIDCIWLDSKSPRAFFEVEHSTGVTSGLLRMLKFKTDFIPLETRYIIVADDNQRTDVMNKANEEYVLGLHPYYFPYSAVEELYSLCQRRNIKGINNDFLESFLEPCQQ